MGVSSRQPSCNACELSKLGSLREEGEQAQVGAMPFFASARNGNEKSQSAAYWPGTQGASPTKESDSNLRPETLVCYLPFFLLLSDTEVVSVSPHVQSLQLALGSRVGL